MIYVLSFNKVYPRDPFPLLAGVLILIPDLRYLILGYSGHMKHVAVMQLILKIYAINSCQILNLIFLKVKVQLLI